jgi:hypothetical protein
MRGVRLRLFENALLELFETPMAIEIMERTKRSTFNR